MVKKSFSSNWRKI